MNRRQRQLIIHSFLYYELNTNLIEDSTFDEWSSELVAIAKKHPEEFKETEYHFYFKDFDGSTGMDLPYRMAWVEAVATRLLRNRGKY